MEEFKTIEVNKAYIIYQVNIKNKYKNHTVFINLSTAKKVKASIEKIYNISGSEVYINKLIGFLDENYIHCTNGFKYDIFLLKDNENKFSVNTDDVVMEFYKNSKMSNLI